MKIPILVFAILIGNQILYSQCYIQYNYDASGHVAIVGAVARAYSYSIGTSGSNNSIAKTQFGFVNSEKFTKGGMYVFRRYAEK